MAEAAAVCLEAEEHSPDQRAILRVHGEFAGELDLSWDAAPPSAAATWADEPYATEQGAYGIALLLVEESTGLTAVERARKGGGFDYWLGAEDAGQDLFQSRTRLEVSGIRRGSRSVVQSRVRRKLQQTQKYDEPLPAIIVVVEFGDPQAETVTT